MKSERRLKVAIAGLGWGAVHLRGVVASDIAEPCALWSRSDNPSNRHFADRQNLPLFTDFAQMLEQAKPDVVCVAVPESAHESLTLAALDFGCDVYCEKVLADSPQAASRMIERAAEKQSRLNVGYNYRYSPSCRYLAQAVHAGKIGRPLFAHLRAFGWCVHHMTEFVGSLMGPAEQVAASITRPPLEGRKAPNSVTFPTFMYSAATRKNYMIRYRNGAVLMAGATDYSSAKEPGACLLVEGTDGRIELNDLAGRVTIWNGSREATVFTPSQICDATGLLDSCVAAVDDFLQAVADDRPAPVPGQRGLEMILLEEAVQRAATSEQWEPVAIGV